MTGIKGTSGNRLQKRKKINQGHPFVRTQDGFQCEGGRHALACLLTCWGASWQSLNLTTASALRLHFLLRWLALRPQRSRSPLCRRARIVGAGNEGAWRAGCVLSLSWKKKRKTVEFVSCLYYQYRSGNQGRAIANILWEKHFGKLTLRTPGEASRLPWACSTQAYLSCFCEEGCL